MLAAIEACSSAINRGQRFLITAPDDFGSFAPREAERVEAFDCYWNFVIWFEKYFVILHVEDETPGQQALLGPPPACRRHN